MPAGVQIYSETDSLVVDDTYRNLCLRSKISVSASNFTLAEPVRYADLYVPLSTVNRPLFFLSTSVRMTLVNRGIVDYPYGSGIPHYSLRLSTWSNESIAATTIYVFDDWLPPRENIGFEAFDDAGQCVYNSAWPVLKLNMVYEVPNGQPTFSASHIISGVSTSNIAIAIDQPRTYYHGGALADGYSLSPGFLLGNNQITISLVCWATESEFFPGGGAVPFSGYLGAGTFKVLIADVTGF